MTKTAKSEFARRCAEHGGASIAAYLDPVPNGQPPTPTNGVLKYFVSTNARVPAAAYVLDSLNDERQIFTNLATDHWLWTYQRERFIHVDAKGVATVHGNKLKAWQKVLADRTVADSQPTGPLNLTCTGGVLAGDAPPIPGGGLYAKAQAVAAGAAGAGTDARDKALERALRYYQLAAYALVSRAKFFGLTVGNYVGALLVDDKGSIIGWGVNSKLYHHAEVNLMLKYFLSTPGELPAKTIVFTTLTPCQQCIGLLLSAKPKECEIFYGQYDSGDFGKQGAASSVKLDEKTKPVSIKKADSKPVVAVSLSSAVGEGTNIASRLGTIDSVKTLFDNVFGEIHRKSEKDRDDKDVEQATKKAVLAHIEGVLEGIKI